MREPRSILITGASSGIGAALARLYARPETSLALTGRNAERLAAVTEVCRAAGAKAESAVLDITDGAAASRWIAEVDRVTPLDLVIANAGVTGGQSRQGEGEPLAQVERLMRTNFAGACNTIAPVIPAMRRRGRGQIALVSSLAALRGFPYSPAYCASKAALKVYGEALGAWLRPEGVEVAVVLPGFVDTPMSRSIIAPKPFNMTAERAARIIARRLRRGRRVIAFPILLHLGTRLLASLPSALGDRALATVRVEILPYE